VSEYLNIVADVKAKMESVAGIGIVHDYERQCADLAKFILLFKAPDGKINGWEITRRAVPEHQAGAFFRHHQLVLKGYSGLQDATGSSKIFQVRVDDICAKFRTAEPATPGPWQYRNGDEPDKAPCQVEIINDRMFGSVLCHCAEIALSVTERILA
jgi:hypothetical protein